VTFTETHLKKERIMESKTEEKNKFVGGYIADQLALELQTLNIISSQLKDEDVVNFPAVYGLLEQVKLTLEKHVSSLRELISSRYNNTTTQSLTASLAETFSDVTGSVMGLYNKLRSEKVSKMLRDNHNALSLMALAYSMLYVTAKGLGETETANLASRNLQDVPPLVMKLNEVMPGLVAAELEKRGYSIDQSTITEAIEDNRKAWTQHSQN
jgi:hypothetical protein